MAAYLIANITVTEPKAYAEYRAQVQPTVEKYGGRFLVRGGEVQRVEGDIGFDRCVIIEFPSMDAARRWYDSAEYAPLLKLRMASSKSAVAFLEGFSP